MSKRLKHIALAVFCIYIATVLALCVIKTDNIPELPKYFIGIPLDKIMHFLMFTPFSVLGYMSFYPDEKGTLREIAILGILCILGAGFAISTERLQAMTDYRAFELADLTADYIGVAAGAAIVLIQIFKRNR